jgi:osmotically-inducible protein OsmY
MRAVDQSKEAAMRSDKDLRKDVLAELEYEPSIDARDIGVIVKDGVVTLNGAVTSYFEKWKAERAAERVVGVRAVANEIEVRLPGESRRTDADIAAAAVNALRWNTLVPFDKIKVTVDNGWVSLKGEVNYKYQKETAEHAVRNLTGVVGVSNLIVIKPSVSSTEVKRKIEDALERMAQVDAQKIQVETTDGQVVLKGSVRSWAEREEAEKAAWRAPGVAYVEDQIRIAI